MYGIGLARGSLSYEVQDKSAVFQSLVRYAHSLLIKQNISFIDYFEADNNPLKKLRFS